MDYDLVLLVLGLGWCSLLLWRLFRSASPRLPPGPLSFPVVGALFSVRQPVHKHFASISKRYGPIVYLRIGMAPFVIVNNSEMAEQVLKIHDLEFGDRARERINRIVSFDFQNMITASIGEDYWRKMRRICSTHLFSSKMLKTSAGFRESEMKEAVKLIFQQSETEINLRDVFARLFSNSLCLILFSSRDGLELADLVRGISESLLRLNIGSLIPALDRFDLHGVYKKLNMKVMPRLKYLLQEQLQKHKLEKQRAGDGFVPRDFTDVLVSLDEDELSDVSKMALLSDMVFAGLETQLATIEWTMAELINHPQVMAKAQQEIDNVVGRSRPVQEDDLQNLPYIEAILKESMRLHSAAPMGVPHRNLKPVKLGDYTIPANCKLLINIWAIGNDSGRWSNPEQFQPERFLVSDIPVNGQCFDYIPFSSGRRICPGYPLAMRAISYFLASLLQAFEWRCGKSGIDLEESKGGVSVKMKSDLIAIAYPRVDESIFV